ncbi:MAG: LysE family transporter [Gemmatimonadota bacterium]|uniref:LysE family translocator n=1 Tax=Candidatus Palauibacter scopulicola TaxID=3056741 RepID=UPI0023860E62|nr:LysE family transporter [Candidatus Palauibacter scopulicola]MDE2662508.1 LysE family transporter [Candidatus Palauibacter scopulicola]
MTPGQLLAFNVALLFAIASPGPALLVAVQTTLRSGRAAGIAVGAGLGAMAATWTLLAAGGLGLIFERLPWLYGSMRTAGALYLFYLAYRMWTNAAKPPQARSAPNRQAFLRGVLINLSNPKSVLFAAAVIVAVFPAGLSPANGLVIVANHLLVEIVFYTTLAFCMSTQAVAARYMRARLYLDRASASILGALGLWIAVSALAV